VLVRFLHDRGMDSPASCRHIRTALHAFGECHDRLATELLRRSNAALTSAAAALASANHRLGTSQRLLAELATRGERDETAGVDRSMSRVQNGPELEPEADAGPAT
jgi:hypothetical protein